MEKEIKKGAKERAYSQLENLIERYPILAPIKRR